MTKTRASAATLLATLDAELPALQTADPSMLFGLQDLLHGIAVERIAVAADAMEFRTLSVAKAYAFASVDYPGAAWSFALDTNGVTTVGYFVIDPGVSPLKARAFMFIGGAYQILSVPNSITSYGAGMVRCSTYWRALRRDANARRRRTDYTPASALASSSAKVSSSCSGE